MNLCYNKDQSQLTVTSGFTKEQFSSMITTVNMKPLNKGHDNCQRKLWMTKYMQSKHMLQYTSSSN